jgi:outer membrane biosynthesis protein TonB
MTQKEKNNKVIAAASTIGMYAVLFLVLLFTVAWRAPYPPIPGGQGVSLILGTDDYGSGDVPLDEPVGTQEPEKQKEETPRQEESKEEVKQQTPEEEDKDVVTSTEESPVTVKKEEPKKKEEKKETVKPVESKKEEPKKVEPKKEEPAQPKTVYNPNKTTSATDNKTGTPGSKGDDEGKTGDKGDPRGTPTGAVYKGNPGAGGDGKGGSGGGVSLNMGGWEWVETPVAPKPSEQDQFAGQVTFVFEVDETGQIIKIQKESSTLRAELEKKCREALEKAALVKRSDGAPPPRTEGRVTFTLRVQ